jgi:hypothetical protein
MARFGGFRSSGISILGYQRPAGLCSTPSNPRTDATGQHLAGGALGRHQEQPAGSRAGDGDSKRKNGATRAEIMDKMGWRKHTVRGFMAGAMKKAGYAVESFQSDKGERTDRINP